MTTTTAVALLVSAWAGALLGTAQPAASGRTAVAYGAVALVASASLVWRARRPWPTGDRTRPSEAEPLHIPRPPPTARPPAPALLLLGCVLVAATAGLGGAVRTAAVHAGPLARLATERTAVAVDGTAVTDVRHPPQGGRWVLLRLDRIVPAGADASAGGVRSRERVLVRLSERYAAGVELGGRYRVRGVAEPIDGPAAAAFRQLGVVVALAPVDVAVQEAPPAWLRSTTVVRSRVRQAAHHLLPPAHGSLLTGLVTGDLTGQPEAVADDVLASGLSHLVAVSGSNVALVAAGAIGLVLVLGGGRRAAWWGALATVWWFVVLARAEPSVLRAAAMATLVLGALLVGRRRSTAQLLCTAGVLVLLVDPMLARRLGFALSMAATAGVVLLAPPIARVLQDRTPLPAGLRRVLAATAGAQVAVAPVLLAGGGTAHPVSIPANLVAVPAAAVASAIGSMAAVVATIAPSVAAAIAVTARPALAVVLWSSRTFASAGPRQVIAAVTALGALLLGAAAGVLVWRHLPRRARVAVPALALVAVPVMLPSAAVLDRSGGRLPEAHVVGALDVGQGDAILLGDPAGGWLLVDGGPDPEQLSAVLEDADVRALTAVVATHPHADHVAGLVGILGSLPVGALIIGPTGDSAAALMAAARSADVQVTVVAAGDVWSLGATRLEVLSPPPTGLGEEPNDNSLVIRADVAGASALLTGDAEVVAQTVLRGDPRLDVDVLKVPHHGGATNAPWFLAATSPRTALLSVGVGNGFGHPHPSVLADLAGVEVRRTDRDGTVWIELRPP